MSLESATQFWSERFSGEPQVFASAPGRVNLIGEHTDYNEGFVFPAAISRRTCGLFRLAEREVRLISQRLGPSSPFHPESPPRSKGWGRYASAVCSALRDAVGSTPPPMEGVVLSDLPGGSGLSSSAALELCLVSAWNELAGFQLTQAELAEIAWVAETRYVGVQCGRMDQMTSALGQKGHALFMDMRSLEWEAVPLPEELYIGILDTCKPRSLAASSYNVRVQECSRAVEFFADRGADVRSLRDVTTEMLEQAKGSLDSVAYRRAKHVLSENERAVAFRSALKRRALREVGRLCRESHESLKSDYEVSCPELDAMARAAWNAPGCVGARMTGAGFGGCCVALVIKEHWPEFERSVRASYGMYGFREPSLYPVSPDDGAFAMRIQSPGTVQMPPQS